MKTEIKDAWQDLIALAKNHKAIRNEFTGAIFWMKQGIRDFSYGVKLLFNLVWYLIILVIFIVFFPVLIPVVLYMRRRGARERKAEIKRIQKRMSPVKRGANDINLPR